MVAVPVGGTRTRRPRRSNGARRPAQVLAHGGRDGERGARLASPRDAALAAYDAGRLQLAQAVRVADVAVHGDAVLRTRLAKSAR